MIAARRRCWYARLIAGMLGIFALASSLSLWADVDSQFELSLQGQFFPGITSGSSDLRDQFFAGLEAELTSDFDSDHLIGTFLPYGRIASTGGEMNHADIRELNLLYTADNWEAIGVIVPDENYDDIVEVFDEIFDSTGKEYNLYKASF